MILKPPGRKIVMVKGDTVKFDLDVMYGADHVSYDVMEDDIFHFTMKKYLYDKVPLIEKIIHPSEMVLEITPEDTYNLSFGEYHYNVDLVTCEGEVYTIIPDSIFIILPKV